MASNNIFSYTKRDYEGSRKEGLSQIPVLSDGIWTDLNITDPGIIILDYVHALVDMVNYYQDHQALESFITTAKERTNIFRLAKQLSYKVSSAKSAKVVVTFHSDFYYDHTIKIPKHTRVSTQDSIYFITQEDAYLKAGESEVNVVCMQGTMHQKVYNGTGLSRLSNVEAPANTNQTIDLVAENIDIESIVVTDNMNRTWRPVDYIIFSDELDRVYQADLNPNNSVTIKFGDGERGIVPKETDVITVNYLVTDAENGRIGPNAIVRADPIYDNGKYVEFTVTNAEASVGGSAPQSSTSIRELAPGAIKAQDRAITLSDFENLAKLVDGVADARAFDINVNPDIPFHEVRVLIIPKEENADHKILVEQVYNYLYQRMIPPTNLHVALPSNVAININLRVKRLEDANDGALHHEITETIHQYFKSRAGAIGEDFYPTDLSTIISNIPNVRYVMEMTPSNIIVIEDLSRAVLGELVINIE